MIWRFEPFSDDTYHGGTIYDDAENPMALVTSNCEDGRLMAAAPDMLEQLRRCRTWLAKVAGDHDGDDIGQGAERERQRLLGVIARAEGGN